MPAPPVLRRSLRTSSCDSSSLVVGQTTEPVAPNEVAPPSHFDASALDDEAGLPQLVQSSCTSSVKVKAHLPAVGAGKAASSDRRSREGTAAPLDAPVLFNSGWSAVEADCVDPGAADRRRSDEQTHLGA